MRRHSPRQQVKEAKLIALDHQMFVVEARVFRPDPATDYMVFRCLPADGSQLLGKRSSPAGLRKFVCECAGFH